LFLLSSKLHFIMIF